MQKCTLCGGLVPDWWNLCTKCNSTSLAILPVENQTIEPDENETFEVKAEIKLDVGPISEPETFTKVMKSESEEKPEITEETNIVEEQSEIVEEKAELQETIQPEIKEAINEDPLHEEAEKPKKQIKTQKKVSKENIETNK